MITKKYFEQIKGQLADLGDDESEKRLVGDHCCPDCGAPQLYAGKANFKNGRGFAICINPACDSVEEIGIDREVATCQKCDRLAYVERVVMINGKERKNLACGHSVGWGG